MVKAREIYEYLGDIMPFDTQEKWDNSGLLVDMDVQTEKILCCLDVTKAAVDKAVEKGCKIIVSHHPVIFSGIKSLDNSSILVKLIKNDISVISAHTNFDRYEFGTSSKLAQFCGLEGEKEQCDFAVTVKLNNPVEFETLLNSVKENTQLTLQYAKGGTVSKVFVVAGSGKSMTEEILAAGCDCVVTGESSYHDMLDLSQMGIGTICLGHDESEKISVETLAQLLSEKFGDVQTLCFVENSLTSYI
ncbi:MAG: Nif3-like dinuclear metal center hexameric protein [Ruminococcaceae bacterium]|nr:Nif3-like dinuclear metal center hexameric protein [Oscillospiraceae bacterium]